MAGHADQLEQGGFEKVIANKDEEIGVLLSRVETERDKASYRKSEASSGCAHGIRKDRVRRRIHPQEPGEGHAGAVYLDQTSERFAGYDVDHGIIQADHWLTDYRELPELIVVDEAHCQYPAQ